MKHSWKIWLLVLPVLLLLLLVMSTDIAFYRIPSIINLFRFEREIAIGLLFLALWPIIRDLLSRFIWTPRRGLILHAFIITGLEIVLILPQMGLRKYLNLWDGNPFLAEFPFIWVTVSALIAVIFIAGVLGALINIRRFAAFRRRGNSGFVDFLLIASFLLAAVVFYMTENRHSYQAMTILNAKLQPLIWPIVGFYGIIYLLNVWNMQWLTALSHRQKIIAASIGLPLIASGLLVFYSHLMTPVYAYSVSVKGFTLAALTFLLFFSLAAEVVLLLNLPGAKRYDRLTRQMAFISELGRLTQSGCGLQKIVDYVLNCSMKITGAAYGWLELLDSETSGLQIIVAKGLPVNINITGKHRESLSLDEFLRPPVTSLTVNDVYKDHRTLKMRLIPARWHSLLAMTIMNGATRIGIIYLAKDDNYGFNAEDEQILEPMIVQAGLNLAIAATDDHNGRTN